MPHTKDNLALPITVKASFNFIHSLFWIFIPIYLMEKGYSGFHIGLFLGLSNFVAIISSFPTGIANDRIKSKKIIFLSIILMILYYFGLLNISNVALLAFIFICGGLGRNIFLISMDSLAFKIFDKTKIPLEIAKYLGIVVLVEIFGFIAGGYFINEIGFQGTISGIMILLVITALISLILPITHTFKFHLFKYKEDILRKDVLLFIIVVFLFALHYGAEATSYALFLKERFALNTAQIGLFVGGAVVFLGLAEVIAGRSIHKGLNPKKVFLFGLLVSGIAHVLFALQQDLTWSFILRCIHEVGDGAMIFSIYFGIAKIFNLDRIGGNSSLITLTQIVGSSVGAFIFGPIGQLYGYHVPLFASGITTILSFFILLYIGNKKLQKS